MRWIVVVLFLLGSVSTVPASDPPQGQGKWFPTFTTEWVFETGG